jgi:hypothetical protein
MLRLDNLEQDELLLFAIHERMFAISALSRHILKFLSRIPLRG